MRRDDRIIRFVVVVVFRPDGDVREINKLLKFSITFQLRVESMAMIKQPGTVVLACLELLTFFMNLNGCVVVVVAGLVSVQVWLLSQFVVVLGE